MIVLLSWSFHISTLNSPHTNPFLDHVPAVLVNAKGNRPTKTGVTGECDPPNVGAGNETKFLCKKPLSHLSNPSDLLIFKLTSNVKLYLP